MDSIKEDRCNNFKMDNFKEKSKKTWILKYGVDNPSKSEEIKSKKIKTNLKNNGVENPSQNSDIFEKSQKSGKKINFLDERLSSLAADALSGEKKDKAERDEIAATIILQDYLDSN